MQPDTTKIWTRAEIRVSVGKILVESLGVDEATVTDQAALVRDPTHLAARVNLALTFNRLQRYSLALPLLLRRSNKDCAGKQRERGQKD